jgi:hypothetical protein
MASCHSLARVDTSILGDPLERKIFEATGWDIDNFGDTVTF